MKKQELNEVENTKKQDETEEETKLAQNQPQANIHYISASKQKTLGQKFSNKMISLKITSIGNVDSGKSTLIGVLTKGMADDGRGAARSRVFNYPHEQQTGRTSSIAHEIMGFDELGNQVLPERFVQNKNKYWADIMQNTKKVITFLDLCGHEKYLKTTIFGLVGLQPDYAMIIVGSNMGISRMTKEHLGISLALKLPFFVVLTKIDICPENVYQETMSTLLKILKYPNVNRRPIQIKEGTQQSEILTVAESMESDRICPIFPISAVTMTGMAQLTYFISKLKPRHQDTEENDRNALFEFDINENFMVPGVGLVISGVIVQGTAKLNQIVQLGPDKTKQFRQLVIRSIHMNRMPVEEAYAGQCACFAVKPAKTNDKINREDFRKGMVLLDSLIVADPVWEFEAEVLILHHATTINIGYQAVLHCGVVRQAAQIMEIKAGDLLRTNDKGLVRFKFMYAPEYLKTGLTILLREGRTKILGTIVTLLADAGKEGVRLGKKDQKKLENEEHKEIQELQEIKEIIEIKEIKQIKKTIEIKEIKETIENTQQKQENYEEQKQQDAIQKEDKKE